MKNIRQALAGYSIALMFCSLVLLSVITHFKYGIAAGRNFKVFIIEMLAFLPLMFVLIGLIDAWFPKEKIEKHIGMGSGFKGTAWVILLAMLQAGPLYGAFPVSYILWKKGCSIRNIFIYLGAFSTLKIPMLTFEIGFLGLKFSLLRSLFTLPLFILAGYIMEKYFQNRHFEIKQP